MGRPPLHPDQDRVPPLWLDSVEVELAYGAKVQLTAKSKSLRNEQYGEVRWAVVLTNQNDETVATYELLTMNAV